MPSHRSFLRERLLTAEASAGGAGAGSGGAAADPVLDPASIARLAELDPSGESRLVDRVMSAFQTSAQRLSVQFEGARASGDRDTLRIVAHTLKSSSSYIGALELARCAAALEAAALVKSRPDLTPEIEAMHSALEVAQAAVARRLGASR